MKKYLRISAIVIFILAVVFILFIFVGKNILPDLVGSTIANSESTSTPNNRLLDRKAPFFDLADNSGGRIRMSNFSNTPIVIVFWATWNKDSADQIKILDDYLLNQNIQNTLVKVIGIDSLEESSVVKSFIRRGGYTVPVALDITGNISTSYNVKSLPTTYFIDKDGIVREIYTGVLSEKMIVDKVEKILK